LFTLSIKKSGNSSQHFHPSLIFEGKKIAYTTGFMLSKVPSCKLQNVLSRTLNLVMTRLMFYHCATDTTTPLTFEGKKGYYTTGNILYKVPCRTLQNVLSRTLDFGMTRLMFYHCATDTTATLTFEGKKGYYTIGNILYKAPSCTLQNVTFLNLRPWDDEANILPLCY
jgi:hypothetical protein